MGSVKIFKSALFIALATVLVYLPIVLHPTLVLNRNNDLEEFFWPIVYSVKQQILYNHQFPLWNNLFLSGMPLVSDPQSPLFYPPNIVFLLFPIDSAFILLFILHAIIGGVGMFWLVRYLGLKQLTSFFAAILYIISPKLFGYLEAGHVGLTTSFAWIPFVILGTLRLIKSPSPASAIILAISLAAIFYTHIPTFLIAGVIGGLVLIYTIIRKRKQAKKLTTFSFSSLLILFGLTAITLLPQLEWLPYTTRQILFDKPEIFPQWNNAIEFIQSIFFPWSNTDQIDSEKWIPLGIMVTIFAFYGFLKIKQSCKILTLTLIILLLILVSNNLSLFYTMLLDQKWLALIRVTTRVWFIVNIAVILLAAYGFEHLSKKLNKNLLVFLVIVSIAEFVSISYSRVSTPIIKSDKFATQEVYEYLKTDPEKFRVYCTNRCLSQKEAAIYNLELVDGYNTIQQLNYYKQAWQLTGAYWNYYTLSIPPIGTYTFEKPQPDPISLGEFNTKYVISPYKLTDGNFVLEKEINGLLIYKNTLVKSRAYNINDKNEHVGLLEITKYKPNEIIVNTTDSKTNKVVLAEVYSPGWKAYTNGKKEISVLEKPNTLRQIDLPTGTKFVTFIYEPNSFKVGRIITLVTIVVLAGIGLRKWKRYYRS